MSFKTRDINNGDDKKNMPSLLPSDDLPLVNKWIDSMYQTMHLDSVGLDRKVFFYAVKGYEYLLSKNKLQKKDILSICDYSQSSGNKRLYVLDLINGVIIYNTYVSHGKNSGSEFASSFSNRNNSHKSSLGFMVTGETYRGKAGYSLHLDGMEKGFNSNVRARNIVLHGSRYVNGERVDEGTMMGRSFGCPAVPYAEHKDIIETIKDGSCFFVYSPDAFYAMTSQILNAKFEWPLAKQISTPVIATVAAPVVPSATQNSDIKTGNNSTITSLR
jgi:hypothetical protein